MNKHQPPSLPTPDRVECIALEAYHSERMHVKDAAAKRYAAYGLLDYAKQRRKLAEHHRERAALWAAAIDVAPSAAYK